MMEKEWEGEEKEEVGVCTGGERKRVKKCPIKGRSSETERGAPQWWSPAS